MPDRIEQKHEIWTEPTSPVPLPHTVTYDTLPLSFHARSKENIVTRRRRAHCNLTDAFRRSRDFYLFLLVSSLEDFPSFFSLLSFPIRRELRSFQRSLRRSGLKHRQATGGNMTNSSWRRKERFNDSSLYRAFCSLGFLPQKRGKARCNEINKRTIFSLSFAESEMKARMA